MLLAFDTLSAPLELIGCDELAPDIAGVLRGWRVREIDSTVASAPPVRIAKTDRGYARTSPWLAKPAVWPDPVDAVCDFLVDLMKWRVAETPGLLCLHAAAAEFAAGTVLFPSTYRAGKSTLSVHLAATGARLIADDVLPIEGERNEGVAPGFLPRLRLSLPADSSAGHRNFVRARAALGNRRYLYLALTDDELAPLGARAPIRGVVLLERRPSGPPELVPAEADEVLKTVILQNFARGVPALDILDRLHAIVAGAACYRLRYGACEPAIALLEEAFGATAPRRAAAGT